MVALSVREIKNMEGKELRRKLLDFRLQIAKEKAQVKIGGTPSNPGKLRELRRSIARIMTELRAK